MSDEELLEDLVFAIHTLEGSLADPSVEEYARAVMPVCKAYASPQSTGRKPHPNTMIGRG